MPPDPPDDHALRSLLPHGTFPSDTEVEPVRQID